MYKDIQTVVTKVKKRQHTVGISIARTPLARSPWLFALVFESLRNSSDRSRKQIFKEAFLFHYEIVCCVYSLESPLRGDSNEYTQHTVIV